MREKISKIVKEALEELNEQLEDNEQVEYAEDIKLIGSDAAFDSMSFVTLMTIIEELITDELDKDIKIVSDKAFSRTNSPFLSIKTLEDFLLELVGEE